MPRLAHRLLRLAASVEEEVDTRWFRLKQKRGWVRPVRILPYLGFGTADVLHLKGRVLEANGIAPARERDTVWKNVRMSVRRFNSAEIPCVRVRARAFGAETVVETDHEGYFDVRLRPKEPLPPGVVWHDVALELLDEVVPGQGPVRACGCVQVPPADVQYGVISDIDDTVLETGATGLLRMLRLTLFYNAYTRTPFEGVSDFYRALEQGNGHGPRNPVFYVSSSPWNLYDLLVQFFEVREIPAGTLMLRDLGLDAGTFGPGRHDRHKLAQIERVLATYPDLRFILVGDSGQRDPEIYSRVVQSYPGRVCAIYIREVTSGAREAEVHALAEAVRRKGVELLLVKDTAAAARHAVERGYLRPDLLEDLLAGAVDNPMPIEEVAEEAA